MIEKSQHIDGDLWLQALRPDDALDLYNLSEINAKHLKEWLPWLTADRCVADTERFIRANNERESSKSGMIRGIMYRGRLAGIVSYNSIDRALSTGDLGFWLAADCEGKGIAFRSASAMIRLGFEVLYLRALTINAATRNERSRALAERLGFRQTGVHSNAEKINGKLIDHAVYRLEYPDWQPIERRA